jgi:hypothetical protein
MGVRPAIHGIGVFLRRSAAMTSRTTQTDVRFSHPFLLPGFDVPQPSGNYRVDYDEESIDSASRLVWRRVGAFIFLPAIGTRVPMQQMVPINLTDLDAAFKKDQQS